MTRARMTAWLPQATRRGVKSGMTRISEKIGEFRAVNCLESRYLEDVQGFGRYIVHKRCPLNCRVRLLRTVNTGRTHGTTANAVCTHCAELSDRDGMLRNVNAFPHGQWRGNTGSRTVFIIEQKICWGLIHRFLTAHSSTKRNQWGTSHKRGTDC
ncbi:hypothetical protein CA54_06670 [Symmachiella macrocystis]|uniref:Uncharacterized protein n=1 Tax=Symmachiella macrocystis TaxID=2527985 RepID=A0A5C6BIK1_9PLAN|nr:hypothetical protein CA54_06670 [Symmachiella macrocystis]